MTKESVKKLKDFVCGKEDRKPLAFIFITGLVSCIAMFMAGPGRYTPDTPTYFNAGDMLFEGFGFDSLRTPIYPLFLKITHVEIVSVLSQYLIFFISIPFMYATLKMLTRSTRLILIMMLLYVIYPAFTVHHNQLITESLSISFSSLFIYFLVKFILFRSMRDAWLFHTILFGLIFIKPAFIYLLAVSLGLFVYYIFSRKTDVLKGYIVPMTLVFLSVVGYCSIMKSTYGVFGISKVSDINIYQMLKQNDLLDARLTSNEEMRKELEIRLLNKNTYFEEAHELSDRYGWGELHEVVQNSLKSNYKSFLFGKNITQMRIKGLGSPVGMHLGNKNPLFQYILTFSLFHLIGILLLHGLLIVYSYVVNRKMCIVSFILALCVWLNLITVLLSSPDDYGRLMVPSLTAILILIMQCLDGFVHFINKKEKRFILS